MHLSRRAQRIIATLKAAGYSARAGEVISGNLGRGADGKFARAGSGSSAAAKRGETYGMPTPRKPAAAPKAAVRRGGGGGKGKKGGATNTLTADRQQARAAERAAERADERRANEAKVGEGAGLGKNLSDALVDFANPDEPQALAPQNQAALLEKGLIEVGADGQARMSAAGRAYVSAARAGDVSKARDAIGRGTDRQALATERGTARAERMAAQLARQQEREQAAADKKAGGGKGGGGGKGKGGEPAGADKQAARTQAATETAAGVGLREQEVGALQRLAAGGAAAADDSAKLTELGLAQSFEDGSSEITDAGRRALAALERGDVRGYQAALQDARDKRTRQQATATRQQEQTARQQRRLAVLATRARNGLKLSDTQRDQLVEAGQAEYDGQMWRLKAQTAQERAMFAKMGGGGSGGGGGGGGKAGAGGRLWKKGPDGKRVPQAGFERRSSASADKKPAPKPTRGRGSGKTTGDATTAYGADPNTTYTMRHRLVDMSEIQASNTPGGAINPKYDPRLQPRDRSRAASQAQIDTVARSLNPNVLATDMHRIDAGSPIIDKHGNVLSGNGRTLALQRANEMHPEVAAAYKKRIREEAEVLGIDPNEVSKMKNPVLVRELTGDTDPVAFAREANSSGTLRMSPLEQAKVDANTISDRSMLKLTVEPGQDIDKALRSRANKAFIDDFLKDVPDNERANLLTRQGDLNQMGLYRVKAAVYTRAFPGDAGERMAESMLESLDPDVKSIQNGISGGLPAFSRARTLISSGQRDADLDIADDFAKSVDMLARIRDNPALTENTPSNKVVAKYLGQSQMFDRELTPDQEKLLVHIDKISRKPTAVRDLLNRYAQIVENQPQPGQSSLFGDIAGLTKSELIDLLISGDAAPGEATTGSMF